MINNKNEELAKTGKDLMLEEPFYGLFLMMLSKQFSEVVPTAGVCLKGINYNLYINAKFWDSLSGIHRKGLLKHELLHIIFFHITDFDHLINKEVRNIAMDLEINQYIDRAALPPGGVVLELFPELNLETKKGTKYYYDKLLQAANNPGTCPNLDTLLDSMKQGQGSCKISKEDINNPDHSTWDESDGDSGNSEAKKKLISNQTKHIVNETAQAIQKSRGTIPSEIAEILDKINLMEEPRFDWRGYLRRFAGGSQKTYTKKLRRKFNKRYEDNPGLKIKTKKHVLVAIDTSGSVSSEELIEFMQEIHHIHKTGSQVTIAHADAAIQKIEPYNPNGEFKVYGRGGTSFDPVVDYYAANSKKYTCLIYLTDGEAPAPETKCVNVLWALSSKSQETDHLPGLTIKLN